MRRRNEKRRRYWTPFGTASGMLRWTLPTYRCSKDACWSTTLLKGASNVTEPQSSANPLYSGRRVETPITLRNLSFTHHSRFVLKFESSGEADSGSSLVHSHLLTLHLADHFCSDLLPPPYSGRLTFRGALEPMQSITLLPTVWITRPGTYSLAGWRLETEVGEVNDGGAWRTRQRFVQGPPAGDSSCISVSNIAAG